MEVFGHESKFYETSREQMKNQKVSYYLVPSEDPHQSEYVDDYFKCRQYISGFTGSAGTFLAGCEEGWLLD